MERALSGDGIICVKVSHLRGYAQKIPKQEYKRESFAMFANMLESLKYEVISTLSKVQVRFT